MQNKKRSLFLIALLVIAVVAVSMLILGGGRKESKKESIGDIICEKILKELPLSDIKILKEGAFFRIEAEAQKENVFAFFEEKFGSVGEKIRVAKYFLPEKLSFKCVVEVVKDNLKEGVRPTIRHMSFNEYEIPESFLDNVVEFPLISVGF